MGELVEAATWWKLPESGSCGRSPIGHRPGPSPARPGGNLTGLSLHQTDLAAKRLGRKELFLRCITPLLAQSGRREMSDLGPQSRPKRTLSGSDQALDEYTT
jgi:hypothetical protein